jgi:AraC family transcriptional regulator of adaptative response / DNA-3-methyladenine glycosylase II
MRPRDHRFDGKFFVGVKTTGIYCRPICPARPKRENVEFFRHRLEAERAGYRPCLRCRPESAPLSPAWQGKSAVVRRALRVMHDQEVSELGEEAFASLFGMGARHLRRLFLEETGKTPKQIFFENRLNLARKLLTETRLPVTEVAFASGFRSLRRFHGAFRLRFGRSPGELRRQPLPAEAGIRVSLSYRPPFDFSGLLDHYASHRVGSLESFGEGKMRRILDCDGKPGKVEVSDDPSRSRLLVALDLPDYRFAYAALARVRNMFDLDSDPLWVANALESSSPFRALWRRFPGTRLPSGWDPFETAVATILGQLVSVERGRALVAQLTEALGASAGDAAVNFFPSPAAIAASELSFLGTTGARKRTLRLFARAVAEGQISLAPTQDVEGFVTRVQSLPGIGPWTAQYMALKCLRHTDAFPANDLVLARMVKAWPAEELEKVRPWRGYGAALLWREHGESKKRGKR